MDSTFRHPPPQRTTSYWSTGSWIKRDFVLASYEIAKRSLHPNQSRSSNWNSDSVNKVWFLELQKSLCDGEKWSEDSNDQEGLLESDRTTNITASRRNLFENLFCRKLVLMTSWARDVHSHFPSWENERDHCQCPGEESPRRELVSTGIAQSCSVPNQPNHAVKTQHEGKKIYLHHKPKYEGFRAQHSFVRLLGDSFLEDRQLE